MTQTAQYFPLAGGLDLVTPPIAMPPGRVIAAVNYEGSPRGYRRIDGFERYDGKPKPSEASYWILKFDAGTAPIEKGDLVTGGTSTATGTALLDAVVESGSYGDGDAAGFVVLGGVAGDFQDNENLEVSAVAVAVADGVAVENGATDDTANSTYQRAAIEAARALVAAVPGSGPVRGVWVYDGDVYAFRDNADGTNGVMYKATPSGWEAQTLGKKLDFTAGGGFRLAFTSGGAYEPQIGDEVEGETSGAKATIVSIDLTSGSWAGADAAGTFILGNQEGTFAAENLKVGSNSDIATVGGDSTELVIEEGDDIEGGSSGAKAKVKRIIIQSGSWQGGDAAGFLVLSGVTGTFQAEMLDVDGGASDVATIAADAAAITLPAGGRYEFVNHNFYGASNLLRMYGCSGAGNAFEWDGETFVPIHTGMTDDKPKHIAVHKNHLFLSFAGGSVQHSGVGDPHAWQVILGAGEIGIGQDVTGFTQDVAGVLVIWGRNKICFLYGDDSENWELKTFAADSGAIEWTAQKIGNPIYHDDRGLRNLSTSDSFGDFRMGTITQMVEPIFKNKARLGIRPIASMRVRSKDQYRLFWDDGTGLSVYLGRKVPEPMPFDLGKVVRCCCSSEDENGDEILFFGSDDGWVYQLDSGTSFDGEPVEAFLRLPFNHVGSPERMKRWHGATAEVDASLSVNLGMLAEFGYADPNLLPTATKRFDVRGGGGFWGEANWDEFYWSSPVAGKAHCHFSGIGENVSIAVVSESIYEQPHSLHGMTLRFSYRRQVR